MLLVRFGDNPSVSKGVRRQAVRFIRLANSANRREIRDFSHQNAHACQQCEPVGLSAPGALLTRKEASERRQFHGAAAPDMTAAPLAAPRNPRRDNRFLILALLTWPSNRRARPSPDQLQREL